MASTFVETTKTLIRVITSWLEDEGPLSEETMQAIADCCRVMVNTTPTQDELELQQAALKFAEIWNAIVSQSVGSQSGRVPSEFWTAFQLLRERVQIAERPVMVRERTLKEIVDEMADFPGRYRQAALHFATWSEELNMYIGPFHDAHGICQEHLVRQEIAQPGSVIPEDYERPSARRRREQETAAAEQRLKQVRMGLDQKETNRVNRPAKSMEHFVRIGQYVDVIAEAFGVDEAEVMALAESLGIQPPNRGDDLLDAAKAHAVGKDAASIAYQEKLEQAAVSQFTQPPVEDTPPVLEESAAADAPETLAGDDLKSIVLELLEANPGIQQPAVMAELAELGVTAAPKSVAALLRHNRPQAVSSDAEQS